MRATDKGFWLLVVVAGCWLLSLELPVLEKSWFVAPTGHYGGSPGLILVLLALLFGRWQPARLLLLLLGSLSLCLVTYVLYHNSGHAGPLLGFSLVWPLHLLMLGILGFSPAVKRYLAAASAAH